MIRRLALALLLVALPRLAVAHATLVRSTPAAKSLIAAMRRDISLVFSEEIEVKLASMSIVGPDGHRYDVQVRADPHDVNAVLGQVDSLPSGGYRLDWHVVSADGHPVSGSFVFTIQAHDNSVPAPAPAPLAAAAQQEASATTVTSDVPFVAALFRGLALGTLMALAGLLAFRSRAVGSLSVASKQRSTAVANRLAVAVALLCVGHFVAWLVHVSPGQTLSSSNFSAVAGTDVGRLELWRTGLAVLSCWALLLARRRGLALLFSGAALVLSGAIGHSAAISPMLATPAKVVHLLAGAVWLGGLVWLLTIAGNDHTVIGESRKVSTAALLGVVLVALSGVAQALLFLPTPVDLIRTTYGYLVLAKIAGLLLLLAFGAKHRLRSLPRLENDLSSSRVFHRSLRQEMAVMAVVIILGGVLAYVPTH